MAGVNFFFVLSILAIFTGSVAGQEAPLSREVRIIRAHESIKGLKAGALIVRLPSHQKKIEALKSLIGSAAPDAPHRKRMEKQLEETLAARQEFNENIMAAFREAYHFSEAYFMFDTATTALKNGRLEGIFLDESLSSSPAVHITSPPPYFILRFGSTSDLTTDGVEAMVIMNDELQDLDKPFPYYQRLHDFAAVMGSIFPAPDQKKKDALRIVGKLNKKLEDYYQQVVLLEGG